ncbi:MAG: hypothetical protein J7M25_16800 [Deltaproteobacteria bacterium]|nr:hypothetical protein [Deltaproteobacteria bacterium]
MTVSAIIMMVATLGCTWGLFLILLAVAARSESLSRTNRDERTNGDGPADKPS